MLKLRQICLQRGGKPLFDRADLTLHRGQKVGLIGPNGCGKSSLFALLRGQVGADAGELELPPRTVIAHVAQETPAVERSALEYALDGDQELRALEARLAAAEEAEDGALIADLHAQLDAIDGYQARIRCARLLAGLGFDEPGMQRPVSSFSGGWRMRLNLAQALTCRSDLLLLDEPTNHLDLEAVVWLEQWLRGYQGTLLLISHDRDFLDAVVEGIAQVENGQLRLYKGNYAAFERQRAERLALQQSQYERQQREIAHLRSFVDRFRAKATKATQAQSRLKALARMELIAAAHVDSPFRFEFPPPPRMPDPLLSLRDASVGYAGHDILSGVGLRIQPGTRLGLLGPNGAGKSTLIRLLAGVLPPQAGRVEAADGLRIGYFAQHQLEQLRPDWSPLGHLQRLDPAATEQALRNFLGGFGFFGDQALDPVAPFSGGEKARLALALLVWQKPNLLLLDEPTNHLDLEMREALVMALQGFEGAMVVVSHDRHLLRTTTDGFVWVHDGRVDPYEGDLDDYARQLAERMRAAETRAATPAAVDAPAGRKELRRAAAQQRQASAEVRRPLERRLQGLERDLARLSAAKMQADAELADPALYADAQRDRLRELLQQQAALTQQLAGVEESWLEVSEALEALQG